MNRSHACATLVALFVIAGLSFAGSYGVKNGAIQGVVKDESGAPLSGVTVVAHRQSDPPIIRTASSDGQGNYLFPSMYVGEYLLGFAKNGYRTVSTATGATFARTALGDQVRVFVEPGRTSTASSISLKEEPSQSDAQVTLTVQDEYTGETVEGATVIVGPTTATNSSDGVYQANVPTRYDEGADRYLSQTVIVSAEGFQPFTGAVTPVPDGDVSRTLLVKPLLANVQGRVELDANIAPEQYQNIRVVVENLNPDVAQGRVLDGSGLFTVRVPVSTSNNTRNFNILFLLNGAEVARLNNVVAPKAGTSTVASPVQVKAETVTVLGSVVLESGQPPSGHAADQVVVTEIGVASPISSTGVYSLPGIPVGRQLTLEVTVFNPATQKVEAKTQTFQAISDGSDQPSFRLPAVIF